MYSNNLEDWQQKISEYYNKQEGQPYPSSNQNVLCGYVSTNFRDWKNFVNIIKNLDKNALIRDKDTIFLSNHERWDYINPNNYSSFRGKRFHRIFINKNTSQEIVYEEILPLCDGYCKSFEWF